MLLLDTLRRDHDLIEAVALAFVTYADAAACGEAAVEEAETFTRFFRLFAGRFHHGREEAALFPALVNETEASAERGPIPSLLAQHRELESILAEVEGIGPSVEVGEHRAALVRRYVALLLGHIDAENSVLFPEAEARFRRVSVMELPDAEPDLEERGARDDGARIAQRYAAARLPEVMRGDGCVCCRAFGVTCDGVEREWSSDLEWDDMVDRVG